MTLRTRLLLGYGYLTALLLVTAVVSALGLQRFGRGLDRVLAENVTSMQAAMAMLDALDRQNAATFAALLGDPDAPARLRSADADFDAALDAARQHAFAAGEDVLVAALREESRTLRRAREELLAVAPAAPLAAYQREVAPAFGVAKERVLEVLAKNTESMHQADRRARREAQGFALGLAALVVVALLSLGFMSRALQQMILSRLTELKELGDAIAAGDRTRRFRVRRDDELGLLARHLNVALDRQDAIQAQMEGRFGQQSQLLLGLLAALPGPAGVAALDGDLIASTFTGREEARVASFAERIRAERRAAEPPRPGTVRTVADVDGGGGLTLTLLVSNGARAVGWLVTLDARRQSAEPAAEPSEPPPPVAPAEGAPATAAAPPTLEASPAAQPPPG